MEIPNSIVIFLDGDPRWYDATRFRKFDKSSLQEYIRKDRLIEWAKQKQYESTTIVADNFWQEVIDKLEEL